MESQIWVDTSRCPNKAFGLAKQFEYAVESAPKEAIEQIDFLIRVKPEFRIASGRGQIYSLK